MTFRLLDLFCGAGGAAVGYHRAGFEVVGVDIKPQKHFPFEFHQADAMTYPLEGFDVIHASPPCQHYSAMQHIHKNKSKHPDLIGAIRQKLKLKGNPYILENVSNAPLLNPLMLCGSMFLLAIAKHRYFECSPPIFSLFPSCVHRDVYDPYHGGEEATGERGKLLEVMDITHFMTRPEARNAIPPAYTEWIGKQLMETLKR